MWPSEEVQVETIEWVRDHPCLYDKDDKDFYNKEVRKTFIESKIEEIHKSYPNTKREYLIFLYNVF